jgi:hypothetical protein
MYVIGTCDSDSDEVAIPLLVPQVRMKESLQKSPCKLVVPKVVPRHDYKGNHRCLQHTKFNYVCCGYRWFWFQWSWITSFGTTSSHDGIAATIKMWGCEVRELREKHTWDGRRTDDIQTIKCPTQGWNKSPAVHPLLFCQILTISTIHNDVSVRVYSLGLVVGSKIHYDTYHLKYLRYSTRNTLNCSEPLIIKSSSMASTYHVMSKILKQNSSLLVGLMTTFWFFMVFLSCIWEVR